VDIEFHYYMTYLIAARAGFQPDEAAIVAQAAQEVDDNHIPVAVSAGGQAIYENVISQTMNILRPHHNAKVYPIFHFIPGDPNAPSARRKDGMQSDWVTTPNSPLANEMLDTALRSNDLYRIGASAHSYADTWAHQNFVGKDDIYNVMPGASALSVIEDEISLLRIGHALAGHRPDIPGLIWTDGRLVNSTVDNTQRFLDAARHLFVKLHAFKHPDARGFDLAPTLESLSDDLAADIGPSSSTSGPRDLARIERYHRRALSPEYGGTPMPEYRVSKWADDAFIEQRAGMKTQLVEFIGRHTGLAGDILEFGTRMPFTWREPAKFRETHWYRFQEAVKSHLSECWDVLLGRFPELAEH
jgi:hypothetical protein